MALLLAMYPNRLGIVQRDLKRIFGTRGSRPSSTEK